MRKSVERRFRAIAPSICHFSWCVYQMGACQPFKSKPNKHQMDSILASVEDFIKNPSRTARESHRLWKEYKIANGWRYGKVKSATAKTHPNIIAYEKLPAVETNKDVMHIQALRLALRLAEGKV